MDNQSQSGQSYVIADNLSFISGSHLYSNSMGRGVLVLHNIARESDKNLEVSCATESSSLIPVNCNVKVCKSSDDNLYLNKKHKGQFT